jgi:hypothetical protein
VAQVAPVSKGGRGNEGGVRKASPDLGIDRDDARRATKVADELRAFEEGGDRQRGRRGA